MQIAASFVAARSVLRTTMVRLRVQVGFDSGGALRSNRATSRSREVNCNRSLCEGILERHQNDDKYRQPVTALRVSHFNGCGFHAPII